MKINEKIHYDKTTNSSSTPVLSRPCHKLTKIVSHLSLGLKFTISFIIIAKNYFELNFLGNFKLHNFIFDEVMAERE